MQDNSLRYYGYGSSFYKLIWTGTTKTINPSKMDKTVNDIADVVSDKMKKDGFLK